MSLPLDVEGPVRAEVFVVALVGGDIVLSGPDGPRAWHVEVHGAQHPMEEVRRVLERVQPGVELFHSTSWRWADGAVVLTFAAVVAPAGVAGLAQVPVARADLARSGADRAPVAIGHGQVLEHALRHLAWLAREDEVVSGALSDDWHAALAGYVPAPFEQLHGEEPA